MSSIDQLKSRLRSRISRVSLAASAARSDVILRSASSRASTNFCPQTQPNESNGYGHAKFQSNIKCFSENLDVLKKDVNDYRELLMMKDDIIRECQNEIHYWQSRYLVAIQSNNLISYACDILPASKGKETAADNTSCVQNTINNHNVIPASDLNNNEFDISEIVKERQLKITTMRSELGFLRTSMKEIKSIHSMYAKRFRDSFSALHLIDEQVANVKGQFADWKQMHEKQIGVAHSLETEIQAREIRSRRDRVLVDKSTLQLERKVQHAQLMLDSVIESSREREEQLLRSKDRLSQELLRKMMMAYAVAARSTVVGVKFRSRIQEVLVQIRERDRIIADLELNLQQRDQKRIQPQDLLRDLNDWFSFSIASHNTTISQSSSIKYQVRALETATQMLQNAENEVQQSQRSYSESVLALKQNEQLVNIGLSHFQTVISSLSTSTEVDLSRKLESGSFPLSKAGGSNDSAGRFKDEHFLQSIVMANHDLKLELWRRSRSPPVMIKNKSYKDELHTWKATMAVMNRKLNTLRSRYQLRLSDIGRLFNFVKDSVASLSLLKASIARVSSSVQQRLDTAASRISLLKYAQRLREMEIERLQNKNDELSQRFILLQKKMKEKTVENDELRQQLERLHNSYDRQEQSLYESDRKLRQALLERQSLFVRLEAEKECHSSSISKWEKREASLTSSLNNIAEENRFLFEKIEQVTENHSLQIASINRAYNQHLQQLENARNDAVNRFESYLSHERSEKSEIKYIQPNMDGVLQSSRDLISASHMLAVEVRSQLKAFSSACATMIGQVMYRIRCYVDAKQELLQKLQSQIDAEQRRFKALLSIRKFASSSVRG